MATRAWMRSIDIPLVGILVLLAAYALSTYGVEVHDGAGYVTTSSNVAWAILTVLVLVALLRFTSLPPALRRTIRWAALVAVAIHAIGLLGGLYASVWWFDDALHVSYGLGASILLVRVVQALDLFPPSQTTRLRVSILAIVTALALASTWEIFEFIVGQIQSSRLQADLNDTMLDMIDGSLGGLGAAIWLATHPVRADDASRVTA